VFVFITIDICPHHVQQFQQQVAIWPSWRLAGWSQAYPRRAESVTGWLDCARWVIVVFENNVLFFDYWSLTMCLLFAAISYGVGAAFDVNIG
jgi:hypothetical protein